ncbi:MAG: MlaD family protein [Pseudomonadota bacterium]|nr:MlaD family protein [Pseudomonadota bacterium]
MNTRLKRFCYGLVAFIILVNLIISKKEGSLDSFNNYLATFNKIDGVEVGTDVVISGIKVGNVSKISLINNYPQISIKVEKQIKITDDSSISIQTDGLFGSKFLLIEVGGNNTVLRDGDKFSFTEDSIMIEELLEKIIEIGSKNKKL